MLGTLIVMILSIWCVSISIGIVLGKLFWSPPGQ